MSADCVFCKIIRSGHPASCVYRDKEISAFLDIHPVNRGHVLIIPNEHHQFFGNVPSQVFSKMALLAQGIQKAYDPAGIKLEGSNFFLSNGTVAGQEVPHAHLHLAPRFAGDGHRKDSMALIDYALGNYKRGLSEPYGIVFKSNPEKVIGTVGWFWNTKSHKSIEIAYALARTFWGQGLMVEAPTVLIDEALAKI